MNTKPKTYLERLWKRGQEFLGVTYPILGGAMSWISESGLVSAISNEGAFGVLAGGNMPPDLFIKEVEKTMELTDKPFGINLISIAPNFRSHLDYLLEIEFPFVIIAGGLPPRDAITKLKLANSKVICFTPTGNLARNLIRQGVDALVIEGHEAGGHIGPVSTSVLAQEILPTITDVPVFIAGGIGSGRMMLHYLMMGASGIQLGSRFATAAESPAHPSFKDALIRAGAKDALPTAQFDPRIPVIPVRAVINESTRDFNTLQLGLVAQLERDAITPREAAMKLEEFWIGGLRKAAIEGDIESGSIMAGQSVGLIKSVLTVREIIDEFTSDAEDEAKRVLAMLQD